jgi:hypothetical protein
MVIHYLSPSRRTRSYEFMAKLGRATAVLIVAVCLSSLTCISLCLHDGSTYEWSPPGSQKASFVIVDSSIRYGNYHDYIEFVNQEYVRFNYAGKIAFLETSRTPPRQYPRASVPEELFADRRWLKRLDEGAGYKGVRPMLQVSLISLVLPIILLCAVASLVPLLVSRALRRNNE